jgi:hypothetical protein
MPPTPSFLDGGCEWDEAAKYIEIAIPGRDHQPGCGTRLYLARDDSLDGFVVSVDPRIKVA